MLFAYTTTAHAETIEIPVASQASDLQAMTKPRTGSSTESVAKEFGDPVAKGQPVGDPPITRWEYQDYYVFFEYDHVIHAVLKHRPINLDN